MNRVLIAALYATTAGLLCACQAEGPADESAEQAEGTSTSTASTGELPEQFTYVALGDSFASMGSEANVADNDFCARSSDNYPGQFALLSNAMLTDVTCQGAVTSDITQNRDTPQGPIPAQVEALNEDTDVVTLTIGGNDINFGALAFCANTPGDCESQLAADTETSLAALPGKLDGVYAAIAQRAPHARIITTGYLPLVSNTANCDVPTDITPADHMWFDSVSNQVNEVVQQAAQRHGATFVMPDNANEHTACEPAPERWTSFDGAETGSFAMHPTGLGQTAMAKAIEKQIRS